VEHKWTLETVHKYIDEPLKELGAGGKKITDEEYINNLRKKYGTS
jgi:hypothetical protein